MLNGRQTDTWKFIIISGAQIVYNSVDSMRSSIGAAAVHAVLVHGLATFHANHAVWNDSSLTWKYEALAFVLGLVLPQVFVQHEHKLVRMINLVLPSRVVLQYRYQLITSRRGNFMGSPTKSGPPQITVVVCKQVEDPLHDVVVFHGPPHLSL